MDKLSVFRNLHVQEEPLLLPNAWDVLSAVILEQSGFKAIGTTSWGMANALGYQDGEIIQFGEVIEIAKRIISLIEIPVSVDVEAGYSDDPETVSDNIMMIADIGAAGINIEDSLKQQPGLKAASDQCALLEKIRGRLDQNGYSDFFINARIDTYLQLKEPLDETVSRSVQYVKSGANGVFVPGLRHELEIRKLIEAVEAPVNVMSLPGLTNVDLLKEWGVKRFSLGNAMSDAVISFIEDASRNVLSQKDTKGLYSNTDIRTEFISKK